MDKLQVKPIKAHDLALQIKKTRNLQKLYATQKKIAAESGTQDDRAAAARTLHTSWAQEKTLDFMAEQVLLAGGEFCNG